MRTPRRYAAALVTLAAAVGLLTGCGDSVNVPKVDAATTAACRSFMASLPTSVAGETARTAEAVGGLVRAYGDPAFTITCGAGQPDGFTLGSQCINTAKTSWYVPQDEVSDDSADVHLSLIGWSPQIQVDLPASYRPSGPAAVIEDLAPLARAHLTRAGSSCQ